MCDFATLGTWFGAIGSLVVGLFLYRVTKQTRDIYDYLARQADRKVVEEILEIHDNVHSMWVHEGDRLEIDKEQKFPMALHVESLLGLLKVARKKAQLYGLCDIYQHFDAIIGLLAKGSSSESEVSQFNQLGIDSSWPDDDRRRHQENIHVICECRNEITKKLEDYSLYPNFLAIRKPDRNN
jgi:hypothetical protein